MLGVPLIYSPSTYKPIGKFDAVKLKNPVPVASKYIIFISTPSVSVAGSLRYVAHTGPYWLPPPPAPSESTCGKVRFVLVVFPSSSVAIIVIVLDAKFWVSGVPIISSPIKVIPVGKFPVIEKLIFPIPPVV